MKETLALDVDDFVSASDVLFRKYDFDKHYDKLAKTYDCEKKMPWKIENLTEAFATKQFVKFPHSEYIKMKRYVKPGNYFFATWNYQLGNYRVGAQGGYGYEQHTLDLVSQDLRKLVQSVVDTYNKAATSNVTWDVIDPMPDKITFESVITTRKWEKRNFLGMRVIGQVLSEMGREMLIIESKEHVKSTASPEDAYGEW